MICSALTFAADMFAGDTEVEMKNRRRNEMVGNVCWVVFGKRVLGFYIEEGKRGNGITEWPGNVWQREFLRTVITDWARPGNLGNDARKWYRR